MGLHGLLRGKRFLYVDVLQQTDLNSNHSPIYLTISDKIITKDQNLELTYRLGLFQLFTREYY
jgi:hypothetical protein